MNAAAPEKRSTNKNGYPSQKENPAPTGIPSVPGFIKAIYYSSSKAPV